MRLSHRPAAAAPLLTGAAALLLAGAAAGCSVLGDDDPGPPSSGGAVRGASFDHAAAPVVQGTFDSPQAHGAKVDIAIMGLRAKGALATLTARLTPHVPGTEPVRINAYRLNGEHGLGTSLIDPVNLKRYVVVKDSGGKELETDDILTQMTNDQPTSFSFTFAAPPRNVKAVDVQIGSWPMFRDVPVQR